jgi:hypothetical protein
LSDKEQNFKIFSAFTFSELIQKMPRVYNNERWSLEMVRGNEYLFCFRYGDHPVQYAPTEACAVAKMLIHLLKNKLLKLDDNLDIEAEKLLLEEDK